MSSRPRSVRPDIGVVALLAACSSSPIAPKPPEATTTEAINAPPAAVLVEPPQPEFPCKTAGDVFDATQLWREGNLETVKGPICSLSSPPDLCQWRLKAFRSVPLKSDWYISIRIERMCTEPRCFESAWSSDGVELPVQRPDPERSGSDTYIENYDVLLFYRKDVARQSAADLEVGLDRGMTVRLKGKHGDGSFEVPARYFVGFLARLHGKPRPDEGPAAAGSSTPR